MNIRKKSILSLISAVILLNISIVGGVQSYADVNEETSVEEFINQVNQDSSTDSSQENNLVTSSDEQSEKVDNSDSSVDSSADNSDTSLDSVEASTVTEESVLANKSDNLPSPPKKGLPLNDVFAPAVGSGVKYQSDSLLQLSSGKRQVGAIWSKNKIDLKKDFKLHFYLYLGDQGSSSADGMTFSLQGYNNSFLGGSGSNLGMYNETYKYYLALEFDTYFNGDGFDSPRNNSGLTKIGDHIGFNTGGTNWHYSAKESIGNMSNGNWKEVQIVYNATSGGTGHLEYTYTDVGTGFSFSTGVNFNFDGKGDHNFLNKSNVYWGFTSSTGAQYEINAMSFEELPQAASIEAKDSTLYVGESWNPKDNFVSAIDEDGNSISFDDNRLSVIGDVDTNKSGDYKITYKYQGTYQETSKEITVTVKEDKSSLKAKNLIYHVGEIFNEKDAFVQATDQDGNPIDYSKIKLYMPYTLDTSKVKTYKGNYYYYYRESDGKLIKSNLFDVTIIPYEQTIQVPKTMDFGNYQLGTANQLYWKPGNSVSVSDEGRQGWSLSVKLVNSANLDFGNYLYVGDQQFGAEVVNIDDGVGSQQITDALINDSFVYVDYTRAKTLRKDSGTLEWSLTPSVKGAEE
ncbi:bacterial Ig-like domain-containing protein [Listeria welshimeri]|uniref:Putative secreted protein n=1 Tax=Listeria welshimeri serovar 6b (strain ATCC 35897 / DSM 20650 / CCUG 15529 / CIP 8149 / NCTC 11857 / SLCC 5334 / V8) TaxID=386043 RepID=A0AGS7_LISW6|nr:bacterial Ig-like domain-containing protein [Listeria welshimeri]CAK20209.1 putative secreted protein [Listeria welshimeri serovar 6b str. SLCC5334]SNV21275.1 Bacterial Ig-like domain (group 3) [Listeria welshimeri]